jgi:hypothetical protein
MLKKFLRRSFHVDTETITTEQIIKTEIRETTGVRRKSSPISKNTDSSPSPLNKSRTSSGTYQSRFHLRDVPTCRRSFRSSSLSVVNVKKPQLVQSSTQVNFPAFFSRSESPEARPVERAIEARTGSEDGLGSMVRCLHFAHTYIANRK